AGILNSRNEPDLYRFQSSESKRKTTTAAKDHLAAYELLEKSNLDWTVVCPTYLPDDEIIGEYRTEIDYLPKNAKKISVGDTAKSEEHTSELQSRFDLVCRLLLEKKKK